MECEKHNYQYTKKLRLDGQYMVKKQCLECGQPMGGAVKFSEIGGKENIHKLPTYDEDLENQYYYNRRKASEKEYQEKWEEKRNEWLEGYNLYLRSDKWQSKRQRVLERDKHICQACLINTATQVHHLTYDHVFNEPLFELVSVCKKCHDKITELDRKK